MEPVPVHNISRVAMPQKQQSFFGKKREPAFFAPAVIQPKLTIAPVNDPYETEADAVADKVMQMAGTETLQTKPSPLNIQRKCEACEAEEKLHRSEDEDSYMQPLQMKPAAGIAIQRQCTACEEEHDIHRMAHEEDEPVQLKPADGIVQRQCDACEHEEQEINRKEAGPSTMPGVTPAVQQSLQSQGRPIDAGTKRFMESRFGYDFGDVQIHNDSLAHQSSRDIKARAYTHGRHIVFGEGQYQPETHAGKQLLAHELTHVVQQNGTLGRKAIVQRSSGEYREYITSDGRSVPYDKAAESIEQLYRRSNDPYDRKRADFIANCRKHGDCDHILTIKEVTELFELSESSGLSLTDLITSYPISRLRYTFAGLIVSPVIDLLKFRAFQHKLLDAGFVILEDPLAVCIQGCHHLAEKTNSDLLACAQPAQSEIDAGEKEVYEIKGNATFEPSMQLRAYINHTLKTNLSAPVKFRFGDFSSGVININKSNKDNPFKSNFNTANNGNNDIDDCFDAYESIGPYCHGRQVMAFNHPAFNTNNSTRTLALKVNINEGNITGEAGWLDGVVVDFIDSKVNSLWFHSAEKDFYPLIFGEENAGRQMDLSVFYNKLESGALNIGLIGVLNVDNQQKIGATFMVMDESTWWKGLLLTAIDGADPYPLAVNRTPEGYISGESKELHLAESWTAKGFALEGALDISYYKGRLSLFGRASFNKSTAPDNPNRFSGEVSVSLTDYPTAEKLFAQHALAKPVTGADPFESNVPDSKEKLGLTAWGNLDIRFVEKAIPNPAKKGKHIPECCSDVKPEAPANPTSLTGSASFLVHPKGYFITAGEVRLKKDYLLAKEFGNSYNIFDKSLPALTAISFGPVKIDLTAQAKLDLCYHVGNVYFRELIAKGYYSNHSAYRKDFTLAGVFDVPLHFGAILDARITATLEAEFLGIGFSLAHAYLHANGKFCLGAYLRAMPAIKVDFAGDKPVYTIGGKLDVNGLMQFALRLIVGAGLGAGDKDISLKETETDDKGNETEKERKRKEIFARTWTLGTFNAGLEMAYKLGSGEPVEFNYGTGKDFEKSHFLREFWNNENSRTNDEVHGGFEGEDKKQAGKVQENEFEPAPGEGDAIGKYALEESFTMNGAPHTLYLIVSGTEPNPEVEILMHSGDSAELTEKIDEEIKEDEITSRQGPLNQKILETKKEEIAELKNIETDAKEVIKRTKKRASNKKAGDVEVKQLAAEVQDFGDKFEKTDLKNDAVTPVAPAPVEEPPKPFDPDKLNVGDVIVEIGTDIGYVVKQTKVKFTAEWAGKTTGFYGFAVHYEPNGRYFGYDYFGITWTIRKVTEVQPFTVSPKDPYKQRTAHVRVGQANWEKGSPAGKINEKIAVKIDYDAKGNDWNQAGHLVAASLGGPGSFRSANIVPMTHTANHDYSSGMRRIESAVWQDINATYAVYDYSVEAIYDTAVQKPPVTIRVKTEKQFPNKTRPSNVPDTFDVNNKK